MNVAPTTWQDAHLRLFELRYPDPIIPPCGACGADLPVHGPACPACRAQIPGRRSTPTPNAPPRPAQRAAPAPTCPRCSWSYHPARGCLCGYRRP